jgi:hypothetical protein
MGDYAVTERTLQVCLDGGPGTGANSRPYHRGSHRELNLRELPLKSFVWRRSRTRRTP